MKAFLQCMIIDSHEGMHNNILKAILMAEPSYGTTIKAIPAIHIR